MNKLIILGLLLAATWTDAAAQQTYEMRCRGGGLLTLRALEGWRIDARANGTVRMTLKFIGGPQRPKIGSDGTRLSAGQCSWLDRDLRPGEPTQIRFDLLQNSLDRQNYARGAVGLSAKLAIDRYNQATEMYPDSQSLPGYLSSADHYWSFQVYNTGKGYLQATSSRVYKPALKRTGPDVLK